jgi:deoxyxylulose-5-phosphate synthase
MPIAESAIVGCAVGAAISGLRPVVEMQFADFLASGFNALVNNAAKLHWRWGRAVPMVLRLPYGGATGTGQRLLGGGPYHSQCPEMWFLRTPGWKIVAPSTPADAKGLMLAAIHDNNPVVFLEAKGLYGFFRTDLREEVPLGAEHEVEIGRATVRREGSDLTILTYGAMVWTSLAAAERLAAEGIAAEVDRPAHALAARPRGDRARSRRRTARSSCTRTPAAAASAASSPPSSPTSSSGSSTRRCVASRHPTRQFPIRRRSKATSYRALTTWFTRRGY